MGLLSQQYGKVVELTAGSTLCTPTIKVTESLSVGQAADYQGIAIGCNYTNIGGWHSQLNMYGTSHSIIRINHGAGTDGANNSQSNCIFAHVDNPFVICSSGNIRLKPGTGTTVSCGVFCSACICGTTCVYSNCVYSNYLNADVRVKTACLCTTGNAIACNYHVKAGNQCGIKFWNGSDCYSINMSDVNSGQAGEIWSQGDYNIYFRIKGTDGAGTSCQRGFVWQEDDGSGNTQNLAHLNHQGLRFASTSCGYICSCTGCIKYPIFRARYANADNSYSGFFCWSKLQLGNNGLNRIIAGATAGGGRLEFVVNNCADGTADPNGTTAMVMCQGGGVYGCVCLQSPRICGTSCLRGATVCATGQARVCSICTVGDVCNTIAGQLNVNCLCSTTSMTRSFPTWSIMGTRYLPTVNASANLPVGWHTIFVNTGSRAGGRFVLRDTTGSRHQYVVFYATHSYGSGNSINVLSYSRYSGQPMQCIRIKDSSTYDGAALQVYVCDACNNLVAYEAGDNIHSSGWYFLSSWCCDACVPYSSSCFNACWPAGCYCDGASVNLHCIQDGGQILTGRLMAPYIRSTGSLCGHEICTQGWFRNTNSSTGLYNAGNGFHFYATATNNVRIYGANANNIGLQGYSCGAARGCLHFNCDNQIHMYDSGGNPRLLINSSTDIRLCNTVCQYGNFVSTGRGYFHNVDEGLNFKGARGCFTNQYMHLYNKVGIGHPSGWGCGETNTPSKGLSTYGGICVGYGDGAGAIARFVGKNMCIGTSGCWDTGSLNGNNTAITNVHFQGHNDFWIGAGNSSWWTTATSAHHDLLINTMLSDATYTRGITFTASSAGASTYRMGRWRSGCGSTTSGLLVDGKLGVGLAGANTLPPESLMVCGNARFVASGGAPNVYLGTSNGAVDITLRRAASKDFNIATYYNSGWNTALRVYQQCVYGCACMQSPILCGTSCLRAPYILATNCVHACCGVTFTHSNWSGEKTKIQAHSCHLYFQNYNTGAFIFRNCGTCTIASINQLGCFTAVACIVSPVLCGTTLCGNHYGCNVCTRAGYTHHGLTNLNTTALWSQPAGYMTMVRASCSCGLPSSHGQSYFGYTVTSKRDTGGGYSALLTAYDNSNLWFTYNGSCTGYPTWRKLWHDGNDGASSGLDADLLDGQHGSYYYAASNPSGYTTCTGDITNVAAGGGISGGGSSGSVTISHADTSSQASVNNSGSNFIQDVTLDTYGHVTGLVTAAAGGGLCGITGSANGSCTTLGYCALPSGTGTANVAIGFKAMMATTTGHRNTASGYRAMCCNTTGHNNTAFGMQALFKNTTGFRNTAVGVYALYNNTAASNTAVGGCAMQQTTTGSQNTAVGVGALYATTSATSNTSSGYQSAYATTTGNNNTTMGSHSLRVNTTGYDNVALGYYAMYSNTSGNSNVAVGKQALQCNTTGYRNVAIGDFAMGYAGCDPHSNVVIGNGAGMTPTCCRGCNGYCYNTFIGRNAGDGTFNGSIGGIACTGDCNVYIGAYTGGSPHNGRNNVLIGTNSGYNMQCGASCNVFIGHGSGGAVTTGCKCVVIGYGYGGCYQNASICAACTHVGTLNKSSGSFIIPHPDPAKTATTDLRHSYVESPTRGDNIYRWQVDVTNCCNVITLPSYYQFLNENDMVWVSPVEHFGSAYGKVTEDQCCAIICTNADGKYNVLLVGTRCDCMALNHWQGVEPPMESTSPALSAVTEENPKGPDYPRVFVCNVRKPMSEW